MPVYAFAVGGGLGIGGKPAYPRDDNPRSSSIFVHVIAAGETVSDGISVVNNTDEEKIIAVYPTNSARASGGSFTCAQRANTRKGVSDWIVLDKDTVTVGPKNHTTVDFTITVPEGTKPGEYNGCVVMQKEEEPEKKKGGVSLSVRSGIRTVITVPGAITRKLENPTFSLEKKEEESVRIQTSVKNTGNVSIDTHVDVGIRNIFGKVVLKNGGSFPVLRGGKKEFSFDFEKLFWGGRYTGYAEYRYRGGSSSLGEDTREPDQTVYAGTAVFYTVPHRNALIIYAAGIVALILFGIFVMPRGKKKGKYLVYTAKKGETIEDISDRVDIPWKKIAKLNDMKAPYQIQEGTKLRIKKKK